MKTTDREKTKKAEEEIFTSCKFPLENLNQSTEGKKFCLCLERKAKEAAGRMMLVPAKLFARVLPEVGTGGEGYGLLFDDWLLHAVFMEKTACRPVSEMLMCAGRRGILFSSSAAAGLEAHFLSVHGRNEHEVWLDFFGLLHSLSLSEGQCELHSAFCSGSTAYRWEGEDRILKICDFLESHYTEDIPQCRVAAMAGVCTKSFSLAFHRVTKRKFIDFLQEIRVNAAAELLRYTDRLVEDIAMSCGFNSCSQFPKVFKKFMLVAPSEYRKQYRKSY